MLAGIASTLLLATPCSQVEVRAIVEANRQYVRGEATCRMARDAEVFVVAYPRVLSTPQGLTDINGLWLYPEGFEPAAMNMHVEGAPLGPGVRRSLGPRRAETLVSVQFRTTIPERNGTFGRRHQNVFLLGGWHPVFSSGADLSPTAYRYRIQRPPNMAAWAANQVRAPGRSAVLEGTFRGHFVPLLLTPSLQRHSHPEVGHILIPRPIRRASSRGAPPWHLRDISAALDEVAIERLQTTLILGARFARRLGLRGAPPTVVVAPLRERLVEPFDGGFAISDRAFHQLGVERFLKLHRLSVWRAQLRHALRHRIETRSDADDAWVAPALLADALACALRERLMWERYGVKEYAPDMLESVAIIPEIDALIFAPQVPFADSYYDAILEAPPHRWRLDNFFHTQPAGKLLYEKLVDRIGTGPLQAVVDRYLAEDVSLTAAVTQITGLSLTALWQPWLRSPPQVDYRLGSIAHNEARIEVEVERDGPDHTTAPAEPISVAIEDALGNSHRVQRFGTGPVTVPAPGPPASVVLDPDRRLVELHHPPGKAPRYNNRQSPRWRFLLNNIAGLIAVTQGELTAGANFDLRRIHDLRYRFNVFGRYSQNSAAGAGASVSYGFGSEITPLRLAHRIGASAAYERLTADAPNNVPSGHQGSVSAFYRYDNRLSPFWAFEGMGWSARMSAGFGGLNAGPDIAYLQAGASAFGIVPMGVGRGLLVRGRVDRQWGTVPVQNQLRLGARDIGARGFERDELEGQTRAIASMEYRHVWEADARTNVFGLVTWHRIEGALFTDAVYLPNDRVDCPGSGFYDVGYGLRFIGDVLNVSPASIQIDIGLPINRCNSIDRAAVSVYLAFVQSFSSF